MAKHQRHPEYIADPIMVLVRYEMEQQLRQAERLRLARAARAAQGGGQAPVSALVRWLGSGLRARSSARRTDPPVTPADALPIATQA